MRKFVIIALLFLFLSCENKGNYIIYEYGNNIITRVDRDSKTYFFYGKVIDADTKNSDISVEYFGFDNLMDGYIVFAKDSIKIIPLSGRFVKESDTKNLFINTVKSNVEYSNWEKKLLGNYKNVCRISNIINREIEINSKNLTEVKIKY